MPDFNDDLISIIIPTYNVVNYLEECINSIMNQSYQNLEIFLVDDGSTDGSSELCDRLKSLDDRIVVIHKSNGGLSDARNHGIQIAKGNYIGFVDSDDWIASTMYEEMLLACKRNNAQIAVCGLYRVFKNSTEHFIPSTSGVYTKDQAITELLLGKEFGDQSCTKLYEAALFSDVSFPVGRLFEDIFTTYKLFLKAEKVVVIDQGYYYYRQREGSITLVEFNPKKIDLVSSIRSIMEDNRIITNDKWNRILSQRELNAIGWTLMDFFVASSSDVSIEKIMKDMFCKFRRNRVSVLCSSQFRSCKLLAVLSFFGFGFTRIAVSSFLSSMLAARKAEYYEQC